jgi:hypothetical protein
MARRTKVYIAAPYSGDVNVNTNNAMLMWDHLWSLGYVPYCPHWTHFQDFLLTRPKEDWLEFDREWLAVCDVVFRLPGESDGADLEVAYATQMNIEVIFNIETLLARFPPDAAETPAR